MISATALVCCAPVDSSDCTFERQGIKKLPRPQTTKSHTSDTQNRIEKNGPKWSQCCEKKPESKSIDPILTFETRARQQLQQSTAMFGFRMLRYRNKHIKQHIQCEEAENRRIALCQLETNMVQEEISCATDTQSSNPSPKNSSGECTTNTTMVEQESELQPSDHDYTLESTVNSGDIVVNRGICRDNNNNCQVLRALEVSQRSSSSSLSPSASSSLSAHQSSSTLTLSGCNRRPTDLTRMLSDQKMIIDTSERENANETAKTSCQSIQVVQASRKQATQTRRDDINLQASPTSGRSRTTRTTTTTKTCQLSGRRLLMAIIYYLTILWLDKDGLLKPLAVSHNGGFLMVRATPTTATGTPNTRLPPSLARSATNLTLSETLPRSTAHTPQVKPQNKRFEYHLNHLQPPARVPLTIRIDTQHLQTDVSAGSTPADTGKPARQARSVSAEQSAALAQVNSRQASPTAQTSNVSDPSTTATLVELKLPLQLHLRLKPLPLPMPPPPASSRVVRSDPLTAMPSTESSILDQSNRVEASANDKQWLNEARQVLLLSSISAPMVRAARLERRSARALEAPPKSQLGSSSANSMDLSQPLALSTLSGKTTTTEAMTEPTAKPTTTTTTTTTSINEARRQRHSAQQIPLDSSGSTLDPTTSNRQMQAMAAAMLPLVWPSFSLLASGRNLTSTSALMSNASRNSFLSMLHPPAADWPLASGYKQLERGANRQQTDKQAQQVNYSPAAESNSIATFADPLATTTEVAPHLTSATQTIASPVGSPTPSITAAATTTTTTSTNTTTTTTSAPPTTRKVRRSKQPTSSPSKSTQPRRKRRKPNYLSSSIDTIHLSRTATTMAAHLPDSTRLASKYAMPRLKFQAHSIRVASKSTSGELPAQPQVHTLAHGAKPLDPTKSQVPIGLSKLIERQLEQINTTNLLQNHKAAMQRLDQTRSNKQPMIALAPTTSVSKTVRLRNDTNIQLPVPQTPAPRIDATASTMERMAAVEMGRLHRHSPTTEPTASRSLDGNLTQALIAATVQTSTEAASALRHSLLAPPVEGATSGATVEASTSTTAAPTTSPAPTTTPPASTTTTITSPTTTTAATTTTTASTTTTTTTTPKPTASENTVESDDEETARPTRTTPSRGYRTGLSARHATGEPKAAPTTTTTNEQSPAAAVDSLRAPQSSQWSRSSASQKQQHRIKLFHFKRKPDANKLPFYKKPLNYTELGWTSEQIQEHLRELALASSQDQSSSQDRADHTPIDASSSSSSSGEISVRSDAVPAMLADENELMLLKRKRRARSQFERLMAELHGTSAADSAATPTEELPMNSMASASTSASKIPPSARTPMQQVDRVVPVSKKKSEPLVMRPMFFVMNQRTPSDSAPLSSSTDGSKMQPQATRSTTQIKVVENADTADEEDADQGEDAGSSAASTLSSPPLQTTQKPIVQTRRKNHNNANERRANSSSKHLGGRASGRNESVSSMDPMIQSAAALLVSTPAADRLLLVPTGLLTPSGSHLRPLFATQSATMSLAPSARRSSKALNVEGHSSSMMTPLKATSNQQTTPIATASVGAAPVAPVMMIPVETAVASSAQATGNSNNKQLAAATLGAPNEQLRVPKLLSKPMRPAKYSLNGYIPKPSLAAAAAAAQMSSSSSLMAPVAGSTLGHAHGSTTTTTSSSSGKRTTQQQPFSSQSKRSATTQQTFGLLAAQLMQPSNKDLDSSTSNEIFSRRKGLQQFPATRAGQSGSHLNGTSRQLEENRRRFLLQQSQQLAANAPPTSLSAQKANKIKAKLGLSVSGNLSGGGKLWTPLSSPSTSTAAKQQVTSDGSIGDTSSASTRAVQVVDPAASGEQTALPLNSIPKTDFECTDRKGRFVSGLFADHKTGCQVWHLCSNNRKYSFLCPSGTIFNAKSRICDWRYNVRCENTLP